MITGEYPPTVGGVGDYTATLAAHLRTAGAHVAVATSRGAGDSPREPNVYRAVPGWGFGGWRALGRVMAAEQPDIIHLQYQAGAFDGKGAIHLLPHRLGRSRRPAAFGGRSVRIATPVLVTFHDLHVPYLFPKAGPLRPLALRALARACAATVVTNGGDYRRLRATGGLGDRLRLIPIGSNIPPAPPEGRAERTAAIRRELGLRDATVLLAYFGLASGSKGLDTLLDALRALEANAPARYHLLVVGGDTSDTDRARFAGADLTGAIHARGLADRVTVTGALPRADVAIRLAAADLAVLPYRDGASWRRGSLLAALAQGTPVVTTTPRDGGEAAGPLPALCDGENALLVPPDDAAALAAAVARAGDDPALRARLAAGARALAASFGWEAIAARHLALYDELLRKWVR